jgi:hypothetical protein
MVLPPNYSAPEPHRRHRFPPQGPALVAASVRPDGIATRAADLELETALSRPPAPVAALQDEARVGRHLAGAPDPELEAHAEHLLSLLGDTDADAFALSVDRHTQLGVTALLACALKRRLRRPVLIGGSSHEAMRRLLDEYRVRGVDFSTSAASPDELRVVFRALASAPAGRDEPVADPLHGAQVPETAPDDWPVPDFSIYDLERYRRDPFLADGPGAFPRYSGEKKRLFLPYHFSFDCQYVCAFCQRGGRQRVKSMDRVIRDLASLAEAHDCLDFMLFDTQINLVAEAFSRALIEARLGVHWTDSFRVAPRRPMDVLETMAKAGCVGLTFGVESASDRVLKRMRKGHTSAQATRVVQDAHALEMFVRVNLLPCFPGETRSDLEETIRWTRENAGAIDDLAPSSFYLAEGSPVGQDAERYGIRPRGAREAKGDHKFRKNLGSLAYDEIGGYTWEEREATLRPAEEELFQAWRAGREGLPYGISAPAQVFALRRDFATKQEAYARVAAWQRGARPRREDHVGRGLPVDLTSLAETPEEPAAGLPPGSHRARALSAVRALLEKHGFVVPDPPAEGTRLSLEIRDPRGRSVLVVLERARAGATFFQQGRRVGLWYRCEGEAPPWLRVVLPRVASLLCGPAHEPLGDELALRLGTLPPQGPASPAAGPAIPRWSVVDLVRQGLKPAASLLVEEDAAPPEGLPSVLSRARFTRDRHNNLVRADDAPGRGLRMRYTGRSPEEIERLRDLEETLYPREGAALLSPAEKIAAQEEIGRLLGFPSCCARAFASAQATARSAADHYTSAVRLGLHLAPFDGRLNHIAAQQYALPFLLHEPCTRSCEATIALVEATLARLYPGRPREILEEILVQGAVLWPDDRVAFFQNRGEEAPGVVAVARFNQDAHPSACPEPRPPERRTHADAADLRVDALRIEQGRLLLRAGGTWRPHPQQGAPLVLLPRRAAG